MSNKMMINKKINHQIYYIVRLHVLKIDFNFKEVAAFFGIKRT